jgi:NADH-quinone oxidoreductase subunit L
VIGGMSGNQSIDRMGGFRRAMPFTFLTFTAGAFALAGFPPFSGWFSKDSIIAFTLHRGGGYVVLAVFALIGALLTPFYAFRMVFRVFFRERVPEARELERHHLAHHPPENPATGEAEDTDVGFPGPEHHIAERSWPMRLAMGPLSVLSLVGGIVLIPGVTTWLEKFLEPTFADSRLAANGPSTGAEWAVLVLGAVLAAAGIAAAYVLYLRRRSLRLEIRERLDPIHTFLFHKWYFDELYELLFVRPALAIGRFGRTVVESDFVQGVLIGGTTGAVRAASSAARGAESGYLRGYALLLLIGLGGLALYFLIVST